MSEVKDLELFHYGVKGMRWGVTREDTDGDGLVNGPPPGKKDLKKQREAKRSAAYSRYIEAEENEYARYKEKRKENRASGQGWLESHRNATKDLGDSDAKRMKEAAQDITNADKEYKEGLKNRLSRSEVRKLNKAGRDQFYRDKAQTIIAESMKNDGADTLVSLRTPTSGAFPTVVTGREFTNYVKNGGAFDIKVTDIYAKKGKHEGQDAWIINDKPNQRYKRIKR